SVRHGIALVERRAAAVGEGGSAMVHAGCKRINRHARRWGRLWQRLGKGRRCRKGRGRVAINEDQEGTVAGEGEAPADPVMVRDDPAIAREQSYCEYCATCQKGGCRPADIKRYQQAQEERPQNNEETQQCDASARESRPDVFVPNVRFHLGTMMEPTQERLETL